MVCIYKHSSSVCYMPWPGVSVVQVHLLFQRDTSGQFQGYWYSLHSTNRFFGEEQIRGVDQWSNFAFLFLVTVESLSTLRRHLPLQRLLVPALADTIPSKWNWKLVVVNKMYTQLLWKVLLVEGKNPLYSVTSKIIKNKNVEPNPIWSTFNFSLLF